jgi:hypothetical protein
MFLAVGAVWQNAQARVAAVLELMAMLAKLAARAMVKAAATQRAGHRSVCFVFEELFLRGWAS